MQKQRSTDTSLGITEAVSFDRRPGEGGTVFGECRAKASAASGLGDMRWAYKEGDGCSMGKPEGKLMD